MARHENVAIFIVSAVMMALKPLLLHLTGDQVRQEAVPPATFQLAVEALKASLCATTLLTRRSLGMSAKVWKGWRHTAAFARCAAVYLVMNVLTVVAARLLPLGEGIEIRWQSKASSHVATGGIHQDAWL